MKKIKGESSVSTKRKTFVSLPVAAFIVATLTALPHLDAPDLRCFAKATVPEAELDGHRMSILLNLKIAINHS